MNQHSKRVLSTEDLISIRCRQFADVQSNSTAGVPTIIDDNAIYIDQKHVATVMRRFVGQDEFDNNLELISLSFVIPVGELCKIKEDYKNKFHVQRSVTRFWRRTAIFMTVGYIIMALLRIFDVLR